MCGRGKIGQAQSIAGQPIARPDQPADIADMIADIVARGAQGFGIRRPAALVLRHMAFKDPLGHQRPAYFCVEFVIKPVRQPAHFSPVAGPLR